MEFYIYRHGGGKMEVTSTKKRDFEMVDMSHSYLEALVIARSHCSQEGGLLIDPDMLQSLLDLGQNKD